MSLFSASKWTILVLPVLGAKSCNSSGGGGNSPSPNSSLESLSSTIMAYVPSGALETLHSVPVINWLV